LVAFVPWIGELIELCRAAIAALAA
jgi:hypothetical protein